MQCLNSKEFLKEGGCRKDFLWWTGASLYKLVSGSFSRTAPPSQPHRQAHYKQLPIPECMPPLSYLIACALPLTLSLTRLGSNGVWPHSIKSSGNSISLTPTKPHFRSTINQLHKCYLHLSIVRKSKGTL